MRRAAKPDIYGLMAEFMAPEELVSAAAKAREAGYRRFEAYSPLPIEELNEVMKLPVGRLPALIFLGGLLGGAGGFIFQYWVSAIAYPLNVGGRPLFSWPAFIPVTFELTILAAALVALVGMLALNGLPEPYHPVFNVPAFELASRNRFFLVIEAEDEKFSPEHTRRFLEGLKPLAVFDVDH
jgi:hypothetical protein